MSEPLTDEEFEDVKQFFNADWKELNVLEREFLEESNRLIATVESLKELNRMHCYQANAFSEQAKVDKHNLGVREKENAKLKNMIDNGLGWEDMRDDH